MLPVLTGDPKKRDELAEKIKSCERELEWSNDGYIIEIDSAGVSSDEICPVRETVVFLASRDLSLLRSYIWKFIEATEREEIAMARLKDACVHAMHAIVVRALHPTEGSQSDLVDLSLMRRIVEEAFGKDSWQSPLFTKLTKETFPPRPLLGRYPRGLLWRTVAEILWSFDRWGPNESSNWSGDLNVQGTGENAWLTTSKDFESFVKNEEIPSNVSFWLYYLMMTTRNTLDNKGLGIITADKSYYASDVRFLFNLQFRNLFGDADDDNHGLMLMESVIHTYIMLNRVAHGNYMHANTIEAYREGFNPRFHGVPREQWSFQWSAIVSLACEYGLSDSLIETARAIRCRTRFDEGEAMTIGRYYVDRYLHFLVHEMRTLLKYRYKWVGSSLDDWYIQLSRIVALFIQGMECLDRKDDESYSARAQEFARDALRDSGLLLRQLEIDWERFVSHFVHSDNNLNCYDQENCGINECEYTPEFLSGCTYEKFDKFISAFTNSEDDESYSALRAALGKHFNWGDDYMVVQKRRAEKAEKLKRLRDSLDAYTQDGEDDPELKKIKLYLEQISCQ
jgi:hypothetical protein